MNTYENREVSADVLDRRYEIALHVGASGEWLLLAVSERIHVVLVVSDDIFLRLARDEKLFRIRHVVIGESQITIYFKTEYKSKLLQLGIRNG